MPRPATDDDGCLRGDVANAVFLTQGLDACRIACRHRLSQREIDSGNILNEDNDEDDIDVECLDGELAPPRLGARSSLLIDE